ncbi:hypothetical protein ACYSNU_04645 [Enterococcus sp. LJL120]
MGRKEFQATKKEKNKWMIAALIFFTALVLVLIAAIIQKGRNTEQTGDTQVSISTTESTLASTTENTEKVFENTADQTESSEFPYAVDIEKLINFRDEGGAHPISDEAVFVASGVNNPNKITLGEGPYYALGLCLTIYPYDATDSQENGIVYVISFKDVPTKEIEIFGGIGTDGAVRIVKVNTEIELTKYYQEEDTEDGSINSYNDLEGEVYYLFYNNQGTVSLATKNFARNVLTAEETKIMLEYTQEN